MKNNGIHEKDKELIRAAQSIIKDLYETGKYRVFLLKLNLYILYSSNLQRRIRMYKLIVEVKTL